MPAARQCPAFDPTALTGRFSASSAIATNPTSSIQNVSLKRCFSSVDIFVKTVADEPGHAKLDRLLRGDARAVGVRQVNDLGCRGDVVSQPRMLFDVGQTGGERRSTVEAILVPRKQPRAAHEKAMIRFAVDEAVSTSDEHRAILRDVQRFRSGAKAKLMLFRELTHETPDLQSLGDRDVRARRVEQRLAQSPDPHQPMLL
jgi:hypothetical protein